MPLAIVRFQMIAQGQQARLFIGLVVGLDDQGHGFAAGIAQFATQGQVSPYLPVGLIQILKTRGL